MNDRIAYWHREEIDGVTVLIPIPEDPREPAVPTRADIEEAMRFWQECCSDTGLCEPKPTVA